MSRSGPAFACPPGAPLYNGVSRFNVGESRRDGRVAEGARLESVYTGNRIVGSNPTLSASSSSISVSPRPTTSQARSAMSVPSAFFEGLRLPLSAEVCHNLRRRRGLTRGFRRTLRGQAMHKLTALKVKNAKAGDKLTDGGGLRLDVDRSGNGAWIFRYTSPATGRERFMGLGPLADVSLSKAREAAHEARDLLRQHLDPIDYRKAARAAAKVEASRAVAFAAYAERFVVAREAGWKNPVHGQQWRNTLSDYGYPHIGSMAVADIDTDAVLRVLRPIWVEKTETASRLRGRIEMILSAAKVEGLRTGENPALWR